MRLTLKLVLVFMLGNILLAAIYGYLAVQREVRLFERTAAAESQTLGHAMEESLAQAARSTGSQGVLDIVRKANDGEVHRVRIRWVWFDDRPGSPHSPAAPPECLTTVTIEQHLAVSAVDADGTPYLHVYWPVALNLERRGGLEFSHRMTELDENKQEIIRRTAWLIGEMVLLSGLLAVLLGIRFVGSPLRQLIEKTRHIASGDLAGPLHLRSHDELADLADSLNGMCARLADSQRTLQAESAARIAALEQLRHADRLKTVGRLAAGIAHELGTPLNVIAGRAELIVSGRLAAEEVAVSAAAIKIEADKMTTIIRQLLDFARASTPHKTPVDLRHIVGQTVDMLHALAEKRKSRLCFERLDIPAVVEVDAGQIQQVVTNLIVNAVQAMPEGGKVEISVRRQTVSPPAEMCGSESSYYAIEIRDYGVGISAEHFPHLFEPFYTTKEVGEGTGLGLSIAYGIVQEHGGWIDVTSQPGNGSCFTVFVPEGPQP